MGNPKKTNRGTKAAIRLDASRSELRGRKSAGRSRSALRMLQILLCTAACCLAAGPSLAVAPSLLNSAAVDGNTSGGNVLSNFTISSGSDRILIVAVDDEKKTHVASVSLGSIPMTYVGGYAEPYGVGNTTSLWVVLEADLPADGAYDITVSGGGKPSVAAMLWSGLYQAVPAGDAVAGSGQIGGNQITTSVVVPQADSLVVVTSGHGNLNGWAAPPAGWTRQWYVEPSSAHHAGATKITAFAGQTSITETCGGGDFNRAAQFVAAFAPAIEPAPGCTGCRYRRPITIDPARLGNSCGADVTNFPLLVTIEADDQLKDDTHDGHVENPSGYDIAFTDANGIPLYHEVERYDGAEGTLVAWVKLPVLSESAETKIYMVYGDGTVSAPTARPAGVWDNNYKGVWHLNQSPNNSAGQILDSTANGNDGQSVSMETGERTPNGRIADALDFDGINDYVSIGTPLGSAHEVTVSAWVKHEGIENLVERYVDLGNYIVIRHDGDNSAGQLHFFIRTGPANTIRSLRVNSVLTMGAWYYVVGTWDGTTQRVYANGDEKASQVPPAGALSTPGSGKISNGSETMDGIIDEVRISNTARDVCWIETEYGNQGNPAAFHTIGAEEDLGAPSVTTYTITASAGLHGSIWPSGDVTVEEGKSATFFLVADQDYEVDSVVINGDWLDYSTAQYRFDNVTADATIQVTFKPVVYGTPEEDDVLPPGCAQNIARDYSTGFDPDNLDIVNAAVDTDRNVIWLNTGYSAINPDRIVIPFRQQVAVTFMYENGDRKHSDFGWMLAGEDPTIRSDPPHRIIYEDINDNDNNGVLDLDDGNTTDRYGDRNGDGSVDARDNREILGTFDAGSEVVFFLKVDDGRYRNNMSNPVTGEKVTDFAKQNEQVYHYTKIDWNESRFTSQDTGDHPEWTCNRSWGGDYNDPFDKTYYLGRARSDVDGCHQQDGWMDAAGLTRAADLFGLNFAEDDTATLSLTWDERWPAVMVGAPAENLNAWVLGFEDLEGGGDMDNNDLIFIIERETGGTAGLKAAAAISPPDVEEKDNIRGVTIGVYDYMPGGACDGKTDISYWLSINAGDPDGETWVEVDGWDEIYQFTLVGGNKVVGDRVTNWEPGSPAYTYRTRRVDFAELGLTGRKLIWRADLKSRKEGCEPEIFDLSLDMTVGTPGSIGRASPTALANVLYNGNMETPALNGSTQELRGHLKCTRIYDPTNPDQTASMELWDAGYVLKHQMEPSDRTIYIPNVTVHAVAAEQLAVGDGATTTFSGRLAHYPVLATTVVISDGYTTFFDRHTDELDAGLSGSGWINRFTGEYRITFSAPPNPNQPITAGYSYFTYNAGGTLREFKEDHVLAAELGLDDSIVIPSGYVYDFNNDGTFSAADANWLINWTRGYGDGNAKSVEKDWILGPVDHSVAAVETPPTASPWYYGTAFPEDALNTANDRAGYRAFKDARADRRSVVYVGARDGMLHAFDAGAFRWIDTDNATAVDEKRGLFAWEDLTGSGVTYCDDITDCPDYGTGRELWAFIPANLLPRLKNNYMQGNDQAYVDASPALADVYVDNAWRTVLLAAEGNGGDTIYCLDVTDPMAPKFMWEFADPELFRSRSSPSVAQIGRILYQTTTKWVAFFVSGKTFNDLLYPSIYVIDIADGSLVKKVALDAEPAGAGGILSGQPTIVDSDGNGYVDRLYIGSDKGRLYKINIPDDPDSTKYRIGHCVINTDFTDRDGNRPPLATQYQPIYGSPAVVSSNGLDQTGQMTYDIRIFFGTGDSPYYDEDINFDQTRYAFYAYRDIAAKGVCDDSLVSLDWFYELPEGHRIYTSAFAAAGNIYFGTSTGETEDPCDINTNSDAGFNPNAGKIYAFDLDNPDKAPSLERVVGNVLASPVAEDKHLYVQSISGDVDSFGDGHYNTAIRQGGIPRISINWWREVF